MLVSMMDLVGSNRRYDHTPLPGPMWTDVSETPHQVSPPDQYVTNMWSVWPWYWPGTRTDWGEKRSSLAELPVATDYYGDHLRSSVLLLRLPSLTFASASFTSVSFREESTFL